MKKVAFHNLGCKVNAYETEAMQQQLAERGYEIVSFEEKADIYVINTCAVTNIADRKSRQMIHRARKRNPQALVVAVGCYVQADPEGAGGEDGADLILGNDQKGKLAQILETGTSVLSDISQVRQYEDLSLTDSPGHTRTFLKIQDGCNQYCSYCLIPLVRGRVRSRRPEDVLAEADRLSSKGFRELVLTGIHLSSYGMDFPEAKREREGIYGTALQRLIPELAALPAVMRIRLGSLEPRIITEGFLRTLASCPAVCPHFHLSLQSGCERTLRRMNRHYTPEEYEEKCTLIRKYFDHPAITTDVIVGFPGETEDEFEETRDFLERIGLYEIHVFRYSRRKGTRADRMQDQVPETVKARRSQILRDMAGEQARQFRSYYIGRQAEVLLEEKTERDGETYFTGYTREYVRLRVKAEGHTVGELVSLTVSEENLA